MQPAPDGIPIAGSDASWLAVDREGQVGWFTIFGAGPTPSRFGVLFEDLAEHERELRRWLITAGSPAERDCVDPAHAAAAGLYALDYDAKTRAYRPTACPQTPIHVESLPEPLRAIAGKTVIRAVFTAEGQISKDAIPMELPDVIVRDLFVPPPGLSELGPPPDRDGVFLGTDLGAHLFALRSGDAVAVAAGDEWLVNSSIDLYARSLVLVGTERAIDHSAISDSESDARIAKLAADLDALDGRAYSAPRSYWAAVVEQLTERLF